MVAVNAINADLQQVEDIQMLKSLELKGYQERLMKLENFSHALLGHHLWAAGAWLSWKMRTDSQSLQLMRY
jgi:hypothetical protein